MKSERTGPGRINIVVDRGWILERCAREVARVEPGLITINEPGDAACTYVMPSKRLQKLPLRPPGKLVGFFTHDVERSCRHALDFDAAVCMNNRMAAAVREAGLSLIEVIRPGVESFRPIVFGVCGRPYPNSDRKGEHLVGLAVGAGFDFVACGSKRWPCRHLASVGQRQRFYERIDYLVVTSLEEGGPMPVIEAIAAGVPVIAPDVGWCWDFPVIRYERGSWPSLQAVLEALTRPPTWQQWGQAHAALFARILAAA